MTAQVEGRGDRWCILRTSAAATVRLAESLAGHGIRAWTPIEVKDRRYHRRATATIEVTVPLAPAYVFAGADQLGDLVHAQAMPLRPHPSFSILHLAGKAPLIADHELSDLRAVEERARLDRLKKQQSKAEPPSFSPGSTVRIDQPAFVGMDSVVQRQRGRRVVLALDGRWEIEVDAWQVLPLPIQRGQSITDAAA